jgi:hypothetical protein
MKKTLRERSTQARNSLNEFKAFTYNNLAEMDNESRFEAILKYIKSLDSKNKSHQIILGEIGSALKGFSPKYAFKEVETIADLSSKGFISMDMEKKLASHLPINEVSESNSVKESIMFRQGDLLEWADLMNILENGKGLKVIFGYGENGTSLESVMGWKKYVIVQERYGITIELANGCILTIMENDVVKIAKAHSDYRYMVGIEYGLSLTLDILPRNL